MCIRDSFQLRLKQGGLLLFGNGPVMVQPALAHGYHALVRVQGLDGIQLGPPVPAETGASGCVPVSYTHLDSPANSLCLCTGSLGCAKSNDIPAMVRKYSAMGRIGFMHIRNVKIMEDGSFEERAHL